MPLRLVLAIFLLAIVASAAASPDTIEKKTEGLTKLDGYFPLYWDQRDGTLWLEIPRFDADFLYVTGLAAGLGSNDIGLDRGQTGDTAVVYFQRTGNKAFLVRRNEDFRSTSANAAERSGRVLVNATNFFVRDGYDAVGALRPGKYHVDDSRSALYIDRTKAF